MLLEAKLLEDIGELRVDGEFGDFHVASGTDSCSQVGWAGKDVPKMLRVHVLEAHGLELFLHGGDGRAETFKHLCHIAASSALVSLLHGNDSAVVLFVDPDHQGLLLVEEESSAIGPIP